MEYIRDRASYGGYANFYKNTTICQYPTNRILRDLKFFDQYEGDAVYAEA